MGKRSDRAKEIFVSRLQEIERITSWVAGRVGLLGDEAQDFASYSKLRLIENDYAVLRRYEGKSKLSTYLTVVIHNQARDWIIKKTGKWRPSRTAQRLGEVAIALERLMGREKIPFDEAVGILRNRYGREVSREAIEKLRAELPHNHFSRSFEGLEALKEMTAGEPSAEERVLLMEQADRRKQTEKALAVCVGQLGDEDQQILRMHYKSGLKISQIARTLGLEQKPLYRRMERLRGWLKDCLVKAGVDSIPRDL